MVALVPVEGDPFAAKPPGVFELAELEAANAGLPPQLVKSVVMAESSGNADAVSPKGARGPMQLMPATAEELGVDPNDPAQNIKGGTAYLKQMLDKYGDQELALMAYNWGPGSVDKWIAAGKDPAKVPAETQAYVKKIMGEQAEAAPVILTPAEPVAEQPKLVPVDHDPFAQAEGAPSAPAPSTPGTGSSAISGVTDGVFGSDSGETEAAVAGAAQGVSAGFGDEIMGAMIAPVEYAGSRILSPKNEEGRKLSDSTFALTGQEEGAAHACRLARMLVTTPHPPCARRGRSWINLPPASSPC